VRVTAKPHWGFHPKNWEEREVPVPQKLISLLRTFRPANASPDDPFLQCPQLSLARYARASIAPSGLPVAEGNMPQRWSILKACATATFRPGSTRAAGPRSHESLRYRANFRSQQQHRGTPAFLHSA
jgi:hypothetical protein